MVNSVGLAGSLNAEVYVDSRSLEDLLSERSASLRKRASDALRYEKFLSAERLSDEMLTLIQDLIQSKDHIEPEKYTQMKEEICGAYIQTSIAIVDQHLSNESDFPLLLGIIKKGFLHSHSPEQTQELLKRLNQIIEAIEKNRSSESEEFDVKDLRKDLSMSFLLRKARDLKEKYTPPKDQL